MNESFSVFFPLTTNNDPHFFCLPGKTIMTSSIALTERFLHNIAIRHSHVISAAKPVKSGLYTRQRTLDNVTALFEAWDG